MTDRPPGGIPPAAAVVRRGERRRRMDMHVRVPAATLLKLSAAAVIAVVAVRTWFVLLLLLLAALLAVSLDPAVRWFERRGLPRSVGVAAVTGGIAAAAAALALLAMPPLTREIGALVDGFAATRLRIVASLPADSPTLRNVVEQLLTLLDSPELHAWIARPVAWGQIAVEFLTGAVLVVVFTVYLLADGRRAYTWLLAYVPRRHRSRVAATVPAVTEVVRAYVRGQFLTSLACGLFTLTVLTAFGVPAALPLALAAAILDVVPVLGTIAVTVPGTLLALGVSPFAAAAVFTALAAYSVLENYVIAPRVYGRTLRLSTLAVALALLAGGLLQGVLGAVLVLPLVAAYPIIERIWLRGHLGTDVVTDHAALAASVGSAREGAVETRVIRGAPHGGQPPSVAGAPVGLRPMDAAASAAYGGRAYGTASDDEAVRGPAERLRRDSPEGQRRLNMTDRISGLDGPLVEGARKVEQVAGRAKEEVVTTARERMQDSRDYISENPLKSVLVALGAGALLGYLLGRRSS